ncbi:hypothetical protein BRC78_02230 [Halobacteriales archaeon QH_8_68_33]|nr:MAG: hypothetical protein BRC78_02230 [Halobacteriales archaeon QH_8_68_33]
MHVLRFDPDADKSIVTSRSWSGPGSTTAGRTASEIHRNPTFPVEPPGAVFEWTAGLRPVVLATERRGDRYLIASPDEGTMSRLGVVAVVAAVVLAGSGTAAVLGVAPVGPLGGDTPPTSTAAGDATDGTDAPTPTATPRQDSDGDGLEDAVERSRHDTNPAAADTDDDGIDDGREVALGTDPAAADTDEDGLPDARELDLGTDATLADTDGDGLADGAELDHDTDPVVADTDEDGIADGRETDFGTNATLADTDGDGLADGAELDHDTDPTAADSDEDGLADGREIEVGTNATLADTDGDSLADGAEVAGETEGGAAIPDADPLRMDLYVQVSVSNGTDPYSEAERAELRGTWADLPVDNPDGSTGVELHLDQRELNETHVIEEAGDYGRLKERYGADSLGNRSGVYRHLLLLEIDRDYAGRAAAPGTFSVVGGGYTRSFDGLRYRVFVAVHELLHNVVGRLDEDNRCPSEFDGTNAQFHTCEGWLSYDRPDEARFLPDGLAEELERDGLLPADSHR